jgi:hypothetical protein
MAEVMDVFVVTCLSSLELTIEHHVRDPIPALDAQNFCGHRPRSPLSPQAAPLSERLLNLDGLPIASKRSGAHPAIDKVPDKHRVMRNIWAFGSDRIGLGQLKLPFLNSDLRRLSLPVAAMPQAPEFPLLLD